MEKNEITIDGKVYVLKNSIKQSAIKKNNMSYAIVRTYSAGVFAGYIQSKKGKEVVMVNVRNLWYWDGAASLTELAMKGVSKPENCKFPCEVDKIEVTEAIEILDCTKVAQESIASVPIWSAQ
jgi:hypothetical protein